MTTETFKVLDSTINNNGPANAIPANFIVLDKPMRFDIDIGAGDTVVIYGRVSGAGAWKTIHTSTASEIVDIYPAPFMKCTRTVDGGSADSLVYVADPGFHLNLTPHTA
jgi:hypothetical protein